MGWGMEACTGSGWGEKGVMEVLERSGVGEQVELRKQLCNEAPSLLGNEASPSLSPSQPTTAHAHGRPTCTRDLK